MQRVKGFKSLYQVKDHERLANCRVENCSLKIEKCKICGFKGHMILHKVKGDKIKRAKRGIAHAHFIDAANMASRNINCYFELVKLKPSDIKETWELKEDIDPYRERIVLQRYPNTDTKLK